MYEQAPQTFDQMVAPFNDALQALAKEVREQILQALPDTEENVYGGRKVANALYSLGGPKHVICGLQPYEDGLRVFFHNWQRLSDAGYPVEGSGKNARHVKIGTRAELDGLDLAAMVQLARGG